MDNSDAILVVDGLVENPLRLSFAELSGFPQEDQVLDVSRFHKSRHGDGVTFEALIRRVRPLADANYVTLHATRDDFHVSIPIEPLLTEGIVVYKRAGFPLGPDSHGPTRFLVKDPTACSTGELDDCANVKYLDRIEFMSRKGRDTRPLTEAEHAALHERERVANAQAVQPHDAD